MKHPHVLIKTAMALSLFTLTACGGSGGGSNNTSSSLGGNQAADRTGDGFGDGMLRTLINDDSDQRQATIDFLQGTSMASPHIAVMFALMKAVHSELTVQEADTLLKAGSLAQLAEMTFLVMASRMPFLPFRPQSNWQMVLTP